MSITLKSLCTANPTLGYYVSMVKEASPSVARLYFEACCGYLAALRHYNKLSSDDLNFVRSEIKHLNRFTFSYIPDCLHDDIKTEPHSPTLDII